MNGIRGVRARGGERRKGGEISRLPLALGLDVNIYYVCLFSPRRWLRPRRSPTRSPAEQSPEAEFLRRLLIRLPPAPKTCCRPRGSALGQLVCWEPASDNHFGVLIACSSSPPWAIVGGW
ncbi:HOXB3 isoform 7 [Pongo abelii]|uniref:HOXB3 isoform 7 n=1 Tax=Pongo abelii TaxID=9601 RepID=A0A2J8W976_PONAB|nr:HOXB3 isoform 7 [Pongo abelii]